MLSVIKKQNRAHEEQEEMKQCSNPTGPHQVEDDARFCGMCGTYVEPEMTSDVTLADVRQFVALN